MSASIPAQHIIMNPGSTMCPKNNNLALFSLFSWKEIFFYLIYYQVFIIVVLKLLKDEEEIAVSKLVTTSYRFISKLQRSFNPSQHWVRSCSAKDNQDFSVDSLYCNLVSSWDTKCFNAKYLRKWVYRLVTLWRVKITEALTNCH